MFPLLWSPPDTKNTDMYFSPDSNLFFTHCYLSSGARVSRTKHNKITGRSPESWWFSVFPTDPCSSNLCSVQKLLVQETKRKKSQAPLCLYSRQHFFFSPPFCSALSSQAGCFNFHFLHSFFSLTLSLKPRLPEMSSIHRVFNSNLMKHFSSSACNHLILSVSHHF